jgi:hypothetical protein
MDLAAIVQDIDAEIDRLQRVRRLLTGHTAPFKYEGSKCVDTVPIAAISEERGEMRDEITPK